MEKLALGLTLVGLLYVLLFLVVHYLVGIPRDAWEAPSAPKRKTFPIRPAILIRRKDSNEQDRSPLQGAA